MIHKRGFASDNNAGIHPRILDAIISANHHHVTGYGDDEYTQEAIQLFREQFGFDTEVVFVVNGTGANAVALQAMCRSYEAVIATSVAHIQVDECGAPERFTGAKLLTVPSSDGKLTVAQIEGLLIHKGIQHHSQPRVVSLSQSTEMGAVYSLDELKTICAYAHKQGLLVHMDGSRIANAAASLNCSLREASRDVGVDVLSFGGTKNGMMLGEAVLFFNPTLAQDAIFIRKQSAQLLSKMRFLSVQFIELLSNDLWLNNARHANEMAQLMAQKVSLIPQVSITRAVQANGVFVKLPRAVIAPLQQHAFFYVWDHLQDEVRWMTSFDTQPEDIEEFVDTLKRLL